MTKTLQKRKSEKKKMGLENDRQETNAPMLWP